MKRACSLNTNTDENFTCEFHPTIIQNYKRMKLIRQTTVLLFILAILSCMSCNKSKQPAESSTEITSHNTAPIAAGSIVYVEIDSIFKYYEMTKDINATFESKQKKAEAELDVKSKNFQSNVSDFQYKAQKGLITQANAQEIQQQLATQQQGLVQLRDQYRAQLADENQVNQRQIMQSIMEYLKEYNKTKGYQYILANTFPSSILYADRNLDITKEVIPGLNAKYKAEQGKVKK
jgi:outer membrane protein